MLEFVFPTNLPFFHTEIEMSSNATADTKETHNNNYATSKPLDTRAAMNAAELKRDIYSELGTKVLAAVQDALAKGVNPVKLVEIGPGSTNQFLVCNPGKFEKLIQEGKLEWTSVDDSEKMLAGAKEKTPADIRHLLTFKQADMTNVLSVVSINSVDIVVACACLYCPVLSIEGPKSGAVSNHALGVKAALLCIEAILKRSGTLAIVTFNHSEQYPQLYKIMSEIRPEMAHVHGAVAPFCQDGVRNSGGTEYVYEPAALQLADVEMPVVCCESDTREVEWDSEKALAYIQTLPLWADHLQGDEKFAKDFTTAYGKGKRKLTKSTVMMIAKKRVPFSALSMKE